MYYSTEARSRWLFLQYNKDPNGEIYAINRQGFWKRSENYRGPEEQRDLKFQEMASY
jgi:hypothetical protein